MATAEEEIEILLKLEKAKAQLQELKDQIAEAKEGGGDFSLGKIAGAAGGALQSAAGQVGSSVGSFASDPVGQGIKMAVDQIALQFPHLLAMIEVFTGSAAASRVSPIAEQYARLTGQQLPNDVLAGMLRQAQGPEQAAAEARNRVGGQAQHQSELESRVFFGIADAFEKLMDKWESTHFPQLPLGGR